MDALPGTKLFVEPYKVRLGFANFAAVMSVTKGLTLSQVCEFTGLEGSTVQNWIKRGWVAHPQGKRYGEYQLARIIIINMLRASLQLDTIAALLRYINGNADDRDDDIIPDSVLYTHLCIIIDKVLSEKISDTAKTKEIVTSSLSDYTEPFEGAREKLIKALTVMTLAYLSSEIKRGAQALLEDIELN